MLPRPAPRLLSLALLALLSSPAAARASDPVGDGLLLHWSFDEALGRRIGDSGQNGIPARSFGAARHGRGKRGGALCFADTHAGAVSGEISRPLRNGFTLVAWLRWSEPNRSWVALAQWGSGAPEDAPAVVLFDPVSTPWTRLNTTAGRAAARVPWGLDIGGAWTHFAVGWEAASGRLTYFIDGQKWEGDRLAPAAALVPGNRLWIGNDARQEMGAEGACVDEVRLYDRALTQEEILALALADDADLGEVEVRVTLDGRPADARLTVLSGDQVYATSYTDLLDVGVARLLFPVGRYELRVGHGSGFTVPEEHIALTVAHEPLPAAVEVRLARAFDPRRWGYYAADLHVHSALSFDGATPARQLVVAELARDLDVAFLSDHDSIEGHAQFAEAAELRGIPYVLGQELSDTGFGHFNLYPLRQRVPPGRLDGIGWDAYFAEARREGALVQVNHPFLPVAGYFNLVRRPNFGRAFDAVEVLNGNATPAPPLTRADIEAWTIGTLSHFWNQGERYAVIGGSDHHGWMEPEPGEGRPVTYARVRGALTAARYIDAVRAGHTFATYGPLIHFTAATARGDDFGPGDEIAVESGESIRLAIEVATLGDPGEVAVIRNGERVALVPMSEQTQRLALVVRPDRDAWYSVRVLVDGRIRALTTPIWVHVPPGGKP